MPGSRHFFYVVAPFLLGGGAIALGLAILILSQVVMTNYWKAGLGIGIFLVLLGGLTLVVAQMGSKNNLDNTP